MTDKDRMDAIDGHIAAQTELFIEALDRACATGCDEAVETFNMALQRLRSLEHVRQYVHARLFTPSDA